MKIFLLDLWQDLKEKRLWPVAVVLLAALVAVPVLLAKPSSAPSAPAPTATAARTEAGRAEAARARSSSATTSRATARRWACSTRATRSRPPKGAIKKQEDAVLRGRGAQHRQHLRHAGRHRHRWQPAPAATPTAHTGGTPGGTPNTGGGTTGGTTTTTTSYKYVVDLTFTANGHTRRIKGMEKLEMLPNQNSPLLIFMGVTPKGSDAVFLVDSTLEAAGEGRCKPSEAECAFAIIGAGSRYMFTQEDGNTYTVRIDEIRKVKVGASAARRGAKAGGAKARAAVGPNRRFVPPMVADLVVVAS